MITDPWSVLDSSRPPTANVSNAIAEFEDNFQPTTTTAADENALPDSAAYLESLERKLHKLQTNNNDTLQQLTARRQHCVESLLHGHIDLPTAAEFGYDSADGEPTATGNLVRHIQPRQAVSPAELLHLLQYDQFRQAAAGGDESDDTSGAETVATTTTNPTIEPPPPSSSSLSSSSSGNISH